MNTHKGNNGICYYKFLKNEDKDESYDLMHYAKEDGPLDACRKIAVEYYVKTTEQYGTQNIIKKYTYGDVVTNPNITIGALVKKPHLREKII